MNTERTDAKIRNMDRRVWRTLRTEAVSRGLTTAELIAEMLRAWRNAAIEREVA